jgi:hypothetical protein
MTTVKTEVQASQVSDPWTAVKRTMYAVGTFSTVILLTLAEILRIFAESFADLVPGSVIAWALGTVALLTAGAGAMTRIMALPKVNEFMKWLNAKAEEQVVEVEAPVEPVRIQYKPITTIPNYPNK